MEKCREASVDAGTAARQKRNRRKKDKRKQKEKERKLNKAGEHAAANADSAQEKAEEDGKGAVNADSARDNADEHGVVNADSAQLRVDGAAWVNGLARNLISRWFSDVSGSAVGDTISDGESKQSAAESCVAILDGSALVLGDSALVLGDSDLVLGDSDLVLGDSDLVLGDSDLVIEGTVSDEQELVGVVEDKEAPGEKEIIAGILDNVSSAHEHVSVVAEGQVSVIENKTIQEDIVSVTQDVTDAESKVNVFEQDVTLLSQLLLQEQHAEPLPVRSPSPMQLSPLAVDQRQYISRSPSPLLVAQQKYPLPSPLQLSPQPPSPLAVDQRQHISRSPSPLQLPPPLQSQLLVNQQRQLLPQQQHSPSEQQASLRPQSLQQSRDMVMPAQYFLLNPYAAEYNSMDGSPRVLFESCRDTFLKAAYHGSSMCIKQIKQCFELCPTYDPAYVINQINHEGDTPLFVAIKNGILILRVSCY